MSITLVRHATTHVFDPVEGSGHQHVWPVKVVATSDNPALPSEIFIFQAGDKLYSGDFFVAVASVAQLTSIGTSLQEGSPYYRQSSVEVNCRSAEEAEDFWVLIKEDVKDLLDNFSASVNMQAAETTVIQ